jgi:hypothetical protein
MRRACFREPVPEIFVAARLLEAALGSLERGDYADASNMVRKANINAVRDWTESLWGRASPYVVVDTSVSGTKLFVRSATRMPDAKSKSALIARDGFCCRFCGIPVIRSEVRARFAKLLPEVPIWGSRNVDQHAAFQCMWLQFDHIVPHARGGDNSIENLVITCAPCNFARMNYLLEEVGLDNPLTRPKVSSDWGGLEGVMNVPARREDKE